MAAGSGDISSACATTGAWRETPNIRKKKVQHGRDIEKCVGAAAGGGHVQDGVRDATRATGTTLRPWGACVRDGV